jgi:hypothetical protein
MSFLGPRPVRREFVGELTASIPFATAALRASKRHRFAIKASAGASMVFSVTIVTECNQIRRYVAAKLAPAFHVMDLQVFHGTAFLASPAVPFEHKVSDYCVLLKVQLDPRSFLADTSRIS